MRVHLVHGIHTVGASPIEGLVSYFREAEVYYPDYGWILGLETRVVNPIVVGTLKPYIQDGDVIVGHSNGCAIAYDLMNAGIELAGAVFINAALKQNIVRPSRVPWIDVYYNSGDEITKAAQLGAELGLDDPVWGEMGHGGYKPLMGPGDPGINNFDCGNTPGMPRVSGHSAFFEPENLAAWGPYLVHRVTANYRAV